MPFGRQRIKIRRSPKKAEAKCLPYPMTNGSHILPQNVQRAISFKSERRSPQILDFRKGQLDKLEPRARHLPPEPREIRKKLKSDRREARARSHIPLIKELLRNHDIGGEQATLSCRWTNNKNWAETKVLPLLKASDHIMNGFVDAS